MRKHVEKPKARRAPVKEKAQDARMAGRDRIKTAESPVLQLEKLLHDTYARRACHL
ncbi:MAG TPA: hypothetical protein VGC27_09650 [Rhizomicrobium sp.]